MAIIHALLATTPKLAQEAAKAYFEPLLKLSAFFRKTYPLHGAVNRHNKNSYIGLSKLIGEMKDKDFMVLWSVADEDKERTMPIFHYLLETQNIQFLNKHTKICSIREALLSRQLDQQDTLRIVFLSRYSQALLDTDDEKNDLSNFVKNNTLRVLLDKDCKLRYASSVDYVDASGASLDKIKELLGKVIELKLRLFLEHNFVNKDVLRDRSHKSSA